MKIITLILIFLINLLYAENIEFYNPSFSCDNVKKDSVEYLICTDKDLSQLDKELSEIYKKTLENIPEKEEFKKEQSEWVSNIRNGCSNQTCLKYVYEKRESEVKSIYYQYTSELSKIEAEIENDEFKDCMANSGGGSQVPNCTNPVVEKYENKIKLLDTEVINSIRTTKKGFFEELPIYYKKEEISKLRITLENIYKENTQTWEKNKKTYFEFIGNTYGVQEGTMWSGVGEMYRITFLKNRIRVILDMKNKIEKGS